MKFELEKVIYDVDRQVYIYLFITHFSAYSDDMLKVRQEIENFTSAKNFQQYYPEIHENEDFCDNLKIFRNLVINKYTFQFESYRYFEKIKYVYNDDTLIKKVKNPDRTVIINRA